MKGSIINVASVAGLSGSAPVAYGTSKAALINMTRALAVAWADRGIRVNALCPGYFPSEMTRSWLNLPAMASYLEGRAIMGRVGKLEELARPVLFLASEASSFMTGQLLVVDGGISCRFRVPLPKPRSSSGATTSSTARTWMRRSSMRP